MYTIDTIPMSDYGLHISGQEGIGFLTEPQEQFFTTYSKEGHQITKRNGNTWEIKGFIMADDLTDFTTKLGNLQTVLQGSGTRSVELNDGAFDCFAKDGFKITGVHVFATAVYAIFEMKLTLV